MIDFSCKKLLVYIYIYCSERQCKLKKRSTVSLHQLTMVKKSHVFIECMMKTKVRACSEMKGVW